VIEGRALVLSNLRARLGNRKVEGYAWHVSTYPRIMTSVNKEALPCFDDCFIAAGTLHD
jgi:hypothetical protein